MVILHIAPINMTRANGFRFSVPGLVSAQNSLDKNISGLLNINNSGKLILEEVNKYKFDFFKSFENIKNLPGPYNKPDIVVFHGVYLFKYIWIYKYLIKERIPYIIVPRVSLTYGAQKQKVLKKKIGNVLFFNRFIKNAKMIHYLTENEKKTSSRFKADSFVVGNGIDIPVLKGKEISECINITFIGRYDINHKGLDIFIESISRIKKDLKDKGIFVKLYGSDYRNGMEYIRNKIRTNKLESILELNNAVYGIEKHRVLLDTDIFIATSRFEGHPMSVLEAMAYGIPCILTKGTNMLDTMIQYDAGWGAILDANDIGKVILESTNDREKIYQKGSNARCLIEDNYTWDIIAKKTTKNYKIILGEV